LSNWVQGFIWIWRFLSIGDFRGKLQTSGKTISGG